MKLAHDSVLILIPAYNEGTVIASVIRSIQKEGWENILVIDDGSTDTTYQEAKKMKVTVLRHAFNRGKGAAVKTGFEAAKKLDVDTVVTIDADGQHDPKDIQKLVAKIKEGYEVVLGKRDFAEKHIPRYKAFSNYLGNMFTWMLYGLRVQDSQSGIRAYNKRAVSQIITHNDRYEFETEIVREIYRNKLKWTEIPIKVRYSSYDQNKKDKQSFFSAVKTILRLAFFD